MPDTVWRDVSCAGMASDYTALVLVEETSDVGCD